MEVSFIFIYFFLFYFLFNIIILLALSSLSSLDSCILFFLLIFLFLFASLGHRSWLQLLLPTFCIPVRAHARRLVAIRRSGDGMALLLLLLLPLLQVRLLIWTSPVIPRCRRPRWSERCCEEHACNARSTLRLIEQHLSNARVLWQWWFAWTTCLSNYNSMMPRSSSVHFLPLFPYVETFFVHILFLNKWNMRTNTYLYSFLCFVDWITLPTASTRLRYRTYATGTASVRNHA